MAPFDVSPVFVFLAPRDAGLENVMFTFTFPALISPQCTFWYNLVLFGTIWCFLVKFGLLYYFFENVALTFTIHELIFLWIVLYSEGPCLMCCISWSFNEMGHPNVKFIIPLLIFRVFPTFRICVTSVRVVRWIVWHGLSISLSKIKSS